MASPVTGVTTRTPHGGNGTRHHREHAMDTPPDLTGATTYVVADQPNAVDRWHVLPDSTT